MELQQTPYFNDALNTYITKLIEVCDACLTKYDHIPHQVVRLISRSLWYATKYLIGSSSNQAPYEVIYALGLALRDWINTPCEITTAILDEPNYYFQSVELEPLVPDYTGINFDTKLVNIALPQLYRHRPLYYVALYHELGHFIDRHLKISEYSLLTDPVDPRIQEIELQHRMEYFADLFAACYTGSGIHCFLEYFAPDNPASQSHPASKDRLAVINDFLSNSNNKAIDLFQKVLALRGHQPLHPKYQAPNIKPTFDNIRPYTIENHEEVHGILDAGWKYLMDITNDRHTPWPDIDPFDTERIINDLIEKSIRNRMLVTRWENGTA